MRGPQKPKIFRDPPFAETDVLEPEECRRALRMGVRQWFNVAPSLPVSYALGRQSPRYIWGEVLKFLAMTGAAAKAS